MPDFPFNRSAKVGIILMNRELLRRYEKKMWYEFQSNNSPKEIR